MKYMQPMSVICTGAAALALGVYAAPRATAGNIVNPPIVLPDPLLQYGFDEASGDALDTGTAPLTDGALTGGAARSGDTPGGLSASAIDLSGDNPFAHVLSTDAADLDGLGQLTLTTWLKVNEYTSGNNRLLAKQAAGTFGGFSFNMNATPNAGSPSADNFKLALFLGGSGGFDFTTSNADVIGASDWTFIAATYDTTTNLISYYTGGENTPVSLLGTATTPGSLNPGVIDGGTALFGVGYTDAAPSADTSVNGLQDDVRVYGAALNLAQLEAVRQSNVPEPAALSLLAGLTLLRRRR